LAHGLLVSVVGYLYLSTLSPGAYWLDTSEFVAGAHTLGIVHPPGHPLYAFLAKGWALLIPIGHIAFRMALLSAVLGIGCAWLVASLVRRLAATTGTESIGHIWCGAAAGWLFSMTNACWMQSVRAEVYTLNALLILSGLWLAVRWIQDHHNRWLYAFAVLMGLALANHHYLVFFFLPAPLLVLCLRAEGRQFLRSRQIFWAFALVLLALATYAYLPIRAATDPVINWGAPTTWHRFYDVLSGRTFQGSVGDQASGMVGDNLGIALGMFAEQITLPGLIAALVALVILYVRHRHLGLLFLTTFALNMLTKSVMTIDPNNPDDYGYFLVGVAVLTVALGWLATQFIRPRSQSVVARGGAVLSVLLLTGLGWTQMKDNRLTVDLSSERSAEVLTEAVLGSAPSDSVVLIHYYSFFFNHWYAQLVDGQRPDVAVVQSTFDSKRYDGKPYMDGVRKRWPALSPVLDQFQQTDAFPERALQSLAASRPVFVEPMIEGILVPENRQSVGMVRRLCGSIGCRTDDALAKDGTYWAPLERTLMAPQTLGVEGRKLLAWFHFVHGCAALREGRPSLALQVIERSRRLSGDSDTLSRLEQHAIEFQTLVRRAETAGSSQQENADKQLSQKRRQLREMNYVDLL